MSSLGFDKVVPGGCALEPSFGSDRSNFNHDTTYYRIVKDSLSIFLGFNADCGPDYSTAINISNDTIHMNLTRNIGPYANCSCYFIYDFYFTGVVEPCYYVVNIDDWIFFYGYVEP